MRKGWTDGGGIINNFYGVIFSLQAQLSFLYSFLEYVIQKEGITYASAPALNEGNCYLTNHLHAVRA